MADTSVAITAGAGTLIDTRTESTNSNHRQVIVVGDPATNAGVAPVDGTAGLKVDLGADNDVTVTSGSITVSGTVTANAGTGTLAVSGPVTDTQLRATAVPVSLASVPSALADEAAFTLATTSVTPIAGVYNSTPDTLTTGKAGALQMTAARGLHVHLVDASGGSVSAATAATTDSITAKIATDAIQDGLTACTPKFAVIAAGTSGNNTLVAAVTGKKIRVLAYNFISSGTVNAKFQSGATGTDLTGLKYCVANSGIVAPFNPVGWFETAAATLLNLNLSAATTVGGELVYVEI